MLTDTKMYKDLGKLEGSILAKRRSTKHWQIQTQHKGKQKMNDLFLIFILLPILMFYISKSMLKVFYL